MFEWDEAKRLSNLEKHGLDFLRAIRVFDGRPILTRRARTEAETRFVTVTQLEDGKFYTVIWTQRVNAQRFISFRRARRDEEIDHRALHG